VTIYKDGWLIIPKYGVLRFRKSKPTLRADEVAIYLDIRLPDALYVKPTLQATVTIKDEAVTPEILTPDIVITTAEMIEKATGMKVEIRVVPHGLPTITEYELGTGRPIIIDPVPETVDEPHQDEPYVDPDFQAHDPDRGR